VLKNSNWIVKVLGGVVGVNLTLALAVSAGAVTHPGADDEVQAASVQVEELAAPVRQPGDSVAPAQEEAPAEAVVAEATTTTGAPATTVAKPKTTTPPATKAPVAKAAPTTAAPAVAAPVAPAAAVPAKVARRVPTAAEVQGVVARLKKDIPILGFVSVAPAQIDQAGDQVCTAFDNGQTFAQVKATGLSMIPASITVPGATADWAVRQAVALYCPGHANKLV
jgi:cytoskeletal protein RodZ